MQMTVHHLALLKNHNFNNSNDQDNEGVSIVYINIEGFRKVIGTV